MHKVSIILPTYNEKDNIVDLINAIRKSLNNDVEIIVVDDDSPDKTWQVVENLSNESVKVLRRINKRCLTTAISDGIAMAQGEIVGWMDSDFSMPPEKFPTLLKALDDHDIACGSRYLKGGEDEREVDFFRILVSQLINGFARVILGPSITDYLSGFVLAKKKVFDEIDLRGDYGEYCIDFLYRAKKKGFKISEMPYTCGPRKAGETKTAPNLFKYFLRGTKYITTVLRLRFQAN